MPSKTMKVASTEYKEKLETQLIKSLQDAFKSTFGGVDTEVGNAMALKFARTAAASMAPAICDAIVEIASQAVITGSLTGVVTGACAAGPVTGTNTDVVTGSELTLI